LIFVLCSLFFALGDTTISGVKTLKAPDTKAQRSKHKAQSTKLKVPLNPQLPLTTLATVASISSVLNGFGTNALKPICNARSQSMSACAVTATHGM